jgi:hypothetical protein
VKLNAGTAQVCGAGGVFTGRDPKKRGRASRALRRERASTSRKPAPGLSVSRIGRRVTGSDQVEEGPSERPAPANRPEVELRGEPLVYPSPVRANPFDGSRLGTCGRLKQPIPADSGVHYGGSCRQSLVERLGVSKGPARSANVTWGSGAAVAPPHPPHQPSSSLAAGWRRPARQDPLVCAGVAARVQSAQPRAGWQRPPRRTDGRPGAVHVLCRSTVTPAQ